MGKGVVTFSPLPGRKGWIGSEVFCLELSVDYRKCVTAIDSGFGFLVAEPWCCVVLVRYFEYLFLLSFSTLCHTQSTHSNYTSDGQSALMLAPRCLVPF